MDLKNKQPIPKFLFLLSFVELWERFSYHGVRALLVLYLTLGLGYDDDYSFKIYSLYAIISYGGTIIFGILADQYFSFLFLTRVGAIITSLGHFLITLSIFNVILLHFGIACIAFGTACFKGNIANLLSNCYSHHPEYSRELGFTYFYTFVSIGGFIAYVFCGIASKFIDYSYCFTMAGCGMLIVIAILIIHSKFFTRYEYLSRNNINKFILRDNVKKFFCLISFFTLIMLGFLFSRLELLIKFINYFSLSAVTYYLYVIKSESDKENRQRLILSTIFILIAAAYYLTAMQLGSFLSLFLHRNVDRIIWGFEMPVALCQSVYPGSTIMVGTIITILLKTYDLNRFIFSRLTTGLFCTCLAFITLYCGCLYANSDFKVNILSFISAIFFMGIGEVLVMPVVISQITSIVPKSRQGFIMGSLMMSLSLSNLGGLYISKLFSINVSDMTDFHLANSLNIYKEGFIKIVLLNLFFVMIIGFCAMRFKKRLQSFKHN